MSLGLVFLDEYANSFNRHCPPEIRSNVIRYGYYWEDVTRALPRDLGLKQLHVMFEHQDFTSFVDVFKYVCDNLDKQYLVIRKARKELFAWDISGERGCVINLDLNRCDELVDWTVNEPALLPYHPHSNLALGPLSRNPRWGWAPD